MEFENIGKLNKEDHSVDNLDLREIIEKYLNHWKWFLITSVLSILFGYLYLNFKRPIYEANASIKIKNEQSGDRTASSAFQDLGIMGPANQNVEDEMEILLSKDLISEVIKSLKFNIQYFTNKNSISEFVDDNFSLTTEFYEKEIYIDPPLKVNFLINDSILFRTNASFIISIKSSSHFLITDNETYSEEKHAFGESFKTTFGDIIITPNPNLALNKLVGLKVLIKISTINDLANSYASKLEITPKSEYSSVLSLKITDGIKLKAEDFLNELVEKYNERAIYLKDELSKSTSDFVNKRLEIISNELSNVDLTAETIKTRYRISDVASETGLNMESGRAVENQIVEANTQLEKIEYIKDYVSSKGNNDLIPVNIGVGNNEVLSSIQQYNQLMLEKKRLLENSTEKNPIVVNLNEQLISLKVNIDQGLNNLESSQKISLDALNKQDVRISSKLYAAPRQERQYRDIQRQQQIKESLYLYLLEKREETALTLGVADPNAKIIDSPKSFSNPVAPNKVFIYFTLLVVGLVIPFIIIYFTDMLDSRIHTRQDVEKVLNIPIVGDIPKLESNKNYIIKKDDYSSVAEAFRIVRTNLNFILPQSNNNMGKVISVTSTIAHEGKSFISSNLATVLCHAGKRTLLLGMDIRAPKIKNYLGVDSHVGITNFIINSEINPKDLIVKSPIAENLDVILSGDIAPNPAELLMNSRVEELFIYAKKNYDYIIVDTAAYSMVTDTLLLSKFSDAFIYVIRTNFLDKRMLKYINLLYLEKRLPNLTLLINGVDHKKTYGYGYGYGATFEKSNKKVWWKFNT